MAKINLGNLGNVDVGKKLKTNLTISIEELYERFPDISDNAKIVIKEAYNTSDEIKTKKTEKEITKYFETIKQVTGKFGVGSDEIDEIEKIDKFKGEEMDQGRIEYESGIQTIDRETGKEEGKIVLGRGGQEGKLVPIKIDENLSMFLEHDGTPSEKESTLLGEFSIENVSTKDRLWDIDLKLENISGTDIEEEKISLRELPPGEIEKRNYNITVGAEGKQHIEVNEYISTLNDPNTESYSLTVNQDNEIYCGISIKNTSTNNLSNVKLRKMIPDIFDNVTIIKESSGTAEIGEYNGEKAIFWSLEEIPSDGEQKLEIKLDVNIQDKDQKVRSGKINVNYTSLSSISGIGIEKFDAYTNNAFYIGTAEMDESPDKYECQFTFENKSEFMVRLVNADVYDRKSDKKYIDIDASEIPPLPEGAKWESNVWEYDAEEGEDPNFKTKVEFFVIADHQINTSSNLELNDLELAVASISGELSYDVTQLASFRESTFNATLKVENTGGADLNEVTLKDLIQDGFRAPSENNIIVSLNGNEIEVGAESINVKNNSVAIELKDLRDQDLGVFKPGDVIEVTYPIISDKPSKDVTFISDVMYTANTYPAGKPLKVVPEAIEIEVVHIRKRLIKGKEIIGLVTPGEYEITLYVVNTSKFDLENFEIIDRIPENFEYTDLSLDPTEVVTMEGMDALKWVIESIAPGDRFEIKYKISGEGKPSDAQEFA